MSTPQPSTALAKLRILDLSRVRAGPTCCRTLGDFGADIIKIEAPPGVDPNEGMSGARDGSDMLNLHRNKRCLTLNMKESAGHEIFMRLVKNSDVVVEDFRPDVKERLGIDYKPLSAANPRIILASKDRRGGARFRISRQRGLPRRDSAADRGRAPISRLLNSGGAVIVACLLFFWG